MFDIPAPKLCLLWVWVPLLLLWHYTLHLYGHLGISFRESESSLQVVKMIKTVYAYILEHSSDRLFEEDM